MESSCSAPPTTTATADAITAPRAVVESGLRLRDLREEKIAKTTEYLEEIRVVEDKLATYFKRTGVDSIRGICYLSTTRQKPSITPDLLKDVWETFVSAQESDDGKAEMQKMQQSFMAHLNAVRERRAKTVQQVQLYKPSQRKRSAGTKGNSPKTRRVVEAGIAVSGGLAAP